jgi:hypothetical protein
VAHDVTSPVVEQEAFQGRADDTETLNSATFDYSLNTNFTQDADVIFRVRFELQETAGGDRKNEGYRIEYNHNGTGWTAVGAATPLQYAASGQYVHSDNTTQVIGDGSFVTGDGVESTDVAPVVTLLSESTEHEFCVYIDSAQVADTDTIGLKVVFNDGTDLDNYAVNLTITVNVPVAAAKPVIPFSIGQLRGDLVPPYEQAAAFFPTVPYIPPPAAANPVIGYRIGQLLEDRVPERGPPASFFPLEPRSVPPPVIDFRIGQLLEDRVPDDVPGPQFFSLAPYVSAPPPTANPVINFLVGQWLGDRTATVDALPDFRPVIVAPPAAAAANAVIAYRVGQWLGEKRPIVEPQGGYFKFVGVPTAPANAVIPYCVGQLLEDKLPDYEPPSSFYQFVPYVVPPPIIKFLIGQWLGDKTPEPEFGLASYFSFAPRNLPALGPVPPTLIPSYEDPHGPSYVVDEPTDPGWGDPAGAGVPAWATGTPQTPTYTPQEAAQVQPYTEPTEQTPTWGEDTEYLFPADILPDGGFELGPDDHPSLYESVPADIGLPVIRAEAAYEGAYGLRLWTQIGIGSPTPSQSTFQWLPFDVVAGGEYELKARINADNVVYNVPASVWTRLSAIWINPDELPVPVWHTIGDVRKTGIGTGWQEFTFGSFVSPSDQVIILLQNWCRSTGPFIGTSWWLIDSLTLVGPSPLDPWS